MSKYESGVKQIPYSQAAVYEKVSNLENMERLKDRIPTDRLAEIKDLQITRDSVTINVPPVGELTMCVVERDEPKCVKFATTNSPVPLTIWLQLLPTSETTCKMRLTVDADIPFFLKPLVGNKLNDGIDQMANALAVIPYGDL